MNKETKIFTNLLKGSILENLGEKEGLSEFLEAFFENENYSKNSWELVEFWDYDGMWHIEIDGNVPIFNVSRDKFFKNVWEENKLIEIGQKKTKNSLFDGVSDEVDLFERYLKKAVENGFLDFNNYNFSKHKDIAIYLYLEDLFLETLETILKFTKEIAAAEEEENKNE